MLILVFYSPLFNINLSSAQESQGPIFPAKIQEINYTLPYPGLLSDNPLYFLKALRDMVVNFLISDPLKKADFNLLQADKRLNEGVMLFDKGKTKYSFAISAISKAENYFDEAIRQTEQAKEQKKDIKDITDRLYQAALKHEEVIKKLESRASGKTKAILKSQSQKAIDFQKRVNRLML